MKNIKLLLLLILFILPLWLIAEDWTILVYMAADNGLYSFAEEDIIEMQKAVLPSNVLLIVQADFAPQSIYKGSRRYRIRHDSEPLITSPVITELGDINSGDPNTLKDFIRWGFKRYPAQRKMLVIWSHGDSWFKEPESKWICPDATSQSLMSVANLDMNRALEGSPQLDILLLDACSMQSIEVSTQLSRYADFIIASPTTVPLRGFPYTEMMELFDQPLPEILDLIPHIYTESYQAYGSQNNSYLGIPTSCSVISTAQLKVFNNRFKDFVSQYYNDSDLLLDIRKDCYEFNTMYADVDLGEWLFRIRQHYPDTEDIAQLHNLWQQVIISSSAIEFIHDIGTAALWFPALKYQFEGWWSHYHQLDFRHSGWLSILNRVHYPDEQVPLSPALPHQSQVLNTLRVVFDAVSDPDPLSYVLIVKAGKDSVTYKLDARPDQDQIVFSIPITSSARLFAYCLDKSGNASSTIVWDYTFQSPRRKLLLAPNPLYQNTPATLLFIADAGQDKSKGAELRIYDLRGRLVISTSIAVSEGENRINANEIKGMAYLAAGVYVLRIRYDQTELKTKFVILN